jgi:hypothetical protein
MSVHIEEVQGIPTFRLIDAVGRRLKTDRNPIGVCRVEAGASPVCPHVPDLGPESFGAIRERG